MGFCDLELKCAEELYIGALGGVLSLFLLLNVNHSLGTSGGMEEVKEGMGAP